MRFISANVSWNTLIFAFFYYALTCLVCSVTVRHIEIASYLGQCLLVQVT